MTPKKTHPIPRSTLRLTPEGYQHALTGDKAITIRAGHRPYRRGVCWLARRWPTARVIADITQVRRTTLARVTEAEWRDDGFQSRADMLTRLRRFYPDLTTTSTVTVIRWAHVRRNDA